MAKFFISLISDEDCETKYEEEVEIYEEGIVYVSEIFERVKSLLRYADREFLASLALKNSMQSLIQHLIDQIDGANRSTKNSTIFTTEKILPSWGYRIEIKIFGTITSVKGTLFQ